jgi:hypothetical protein
VTGPTVHLSWAELACKDGTAYPEKWRQSRAADLAAEFEAIRARVGRPIAIGSAYRTPAHNRKVGGARHSQHCHGRALDLYPPLGWSVETFYKVIRVWAGYPGSKIYGLGKYPTFVHIDIRPTPASGRLIVWHGSRAWADRKAGS